MSQELIQKVTAHIKTYMSTYDPSHDFQHIRRVVGVSHHIHNTLLSSPTPPSPPLSLPIITLSALCHDIGDRKYVKEDEDATTMIRDLLLGMGADEQLAQTVQDICTNVSYSHEIAHPLLMKEMLGKHPELAVVQDADRLDAMGAVGIGRVFTYGGARTGREMGESMGMVEGKLMALEGMMKTGVGREMARGRTEQLRVFREWWDEDMRMGEGVLRGIDQEGEAELGGKMS